MSVMAITAALWRVRAVPGAPLPGLALVLTLILTLTLLILLFLGRAAAVLG